MRLSVWIGVAIVVVAGFGWWFRAPLLERLTPPPASPTPPPVQPAKLFETDPQAVRRVASGLVVARPVEGADPLPDDPQAFQYLLVEALADDGSALGRLLTGLVAGVPRLTVVTAALSLRPGEQRPPVPLLILEHTPDGRHQVLYPAAPGPLALAPPVARPSGRTVAVALATYLFVGDNPERADLLVRGAEDLLAARPPDDRLPIPDARQALRSAWEGYAVALRREAALVVNPLVTLHLSLDGPRAPSAYHVGMGGTSAGPRPGLDLRLVPIATLFTGTGDPLREAARVRPDLAAAAIRETGDRLARTCAELRWEIKGATGFTEADAAQALAPLAIARTALGGEADACLGSPSGTPPTQPSTAVRNRVLDRLATHLRDGRGGTESLFASQVVLRDTSGLWLVDGAPELIGDPSARLHPAAEPDVAADYLSLIPARRVGCFHWAGAGGGTLVALHHTPDLMDLDVYFDARGKISALSFGPVPRDKLCRIVRGGGCRFAPTGKCG